MRPWPLVLAAAIALGFTLAAPDELHRIGQTAQRLADDAVDVVAQLAGDVVPAGCSLDETPGDSVQPEYDGLSDEAPTPTEQAASGEDATRAADPSDEADGKTPAATGTQTEAGEESGTPTASRPDAELTASQSEALDVLTQVAGDFSDKVDGLAGEGLTVGDVH